MGDFFGRELNLAEKADDKNPNCAPKNAKKLNLGEEGWLSLFFRIFSLPKFNSWALRISFLLNSMQWACALPVA